ncbi:hypothetical protein AB1Y20_007594 [Prymnesium parvum]|uniref:Bifunctional lysine-specific demethylase and histidyl-hydroxylase n=1 Tax=Prymnesium parvum TaxID=97485 RepID=A0AB34IVT9_PRYPA
MRAVRGKVPVAALCAVACAGLLATGRARRLRLPKHLVSHGQAFFEEELLSADAAAQLRNVVKRLKDFPTNVRDAGFYPALREHIGEAQPIDERGRCADPFLVPNLNQTECILPGRIDIGRHYILTGGVQGYREGVEALSSRVQSFGHYLFDLAPFPEVRTLFNDEKFVTLARRVCPEDKQHLDPFQFNVIVQLPGQTVAAHLDAPYFWGATRFQLPQWLLAAMVFSGRFESRFVDQVQVVAYLHEWERPGKGGDFVHWAEPELGLDDAVGGTVAAKESRSSPTPRSGSAIDGSKRVHAAEVYLGSSDSPALPFIDKSERNILSFEGPHDEGGWKLRANGRLLQQYSTSDLRTSIVYRARCFRGPEEAERFAGRGGPHDELIPLEDVLKVLADEMVRRGVVASVHEALRMDRRALAIAILDTFVSYPLPSYGLVPYNYCVLPRLVPRWAVSITTYALRPFCSSVS